MKYFNVTYISQRTQHPQGHVAFSDYVSAESKGDAKVKALTLLRTTLDPENCMFYKVPRLDEITEADYLAATQPAPEFSAADIRLMCIAMFGEQDEYDADEQNDALALLQNPDDEPETYARYLAPRGVEQLPPTSLDNSVRNEENLPPRDEASDCAGLLKKHTGDNSDAELVSSAGAARTWSDVELDIACALWAGDVDPADVHPSIVAWAEKKVSRRDEDVIAWGLALREVDGALSYGRDFVIDLVRERPDGVDLVRNAAAMDKHVADFVCEFGGLYVKSKPGVAETDAPIVGALTDADKVNADVGLEHDNAPNVATHNESTQPDPVDDNAVVTGDKVANNNDRSSNFLDALALVSGRIEYADDIFGDNNSMLTPLEAINQRLLEIPNGGGLVVPDLPNALYHACDGYSSTQLRIFQQGGLSALDWLRDAPREEVASLSLGTLVHTALLEPTRFQADYAALPEAPRNTKEGMAAHAAFEADCAQFGITAVKTKDHAKACQMRDSALANSTVALLLQQGVAELSVFYRTTDGLLLKVRPDWFGCVDDVPYLMDVKTTADINSFGKSVDDYGYHVQAEFYRFVVNAVFGLDCDFIFCPISSSLECGRYPVTPCYLDEEDSTLGRLIVGELLTGIREAQNAGFTFNIGTVSRPWWAKQADRKRYAEVSA
jgi:exodeoxyribonuclease VIII